MFQPSTKYFCCCKSSKPHQQNPVVLIHAFVIIKENCYILMHLVCKISFQIPHLKRRAFKTFKTSSLNAVFIEPPDRELQYFLSTSLYQPSTFSLKSLPVRYMFNALKENIKHSGHTFEVQEG